MTAIEYIVQVNFTFISFKTFIALPLYLQGLGEIPLDTPSAKGRRSHTGSVGNTRSSSVSRDTFNSAEKVDSLLPPDDSLI